MWLQRYIDMSTRLLVPATILIVAGCASSGPKPAKSGKVEAPVTASAAGQEVFPEITPQAQTMFEQAVSVMASGDFLDAELRLKEFLLQYPAFPGAHVNLAIIHSQNGNGAAAEAAIDAALKLDPNHAAALNQRGMLLRKNGKFIEAEAAYFEGRHSFSRLRLGTLQPGCSQRTLLTAPGCGTAAF